MRKVKMKILVAAVAAVAAAVLMSGCTVTPRGIEVPIGDGWVQGYGPDGMYSYHPGATYGGPICPGVPYIPENEVEVEWGPSLSMGDCMAGMML